MLNGDESLKKWTSPFATLLICGDQDLWPAVVDICVNATNAPSLFKDLIEDGQLWSMPAAVTMSRPAIEPCRLPSHRLGYLFKCILELRQESERRKDEAPRLDDHFRNPAAERHQAQQCFTSLFDVLSRHTSAHLLEIAIVPDNPGGPVDLKLLRRFQADVGMRFPFLSSDAIPLKVLFSNALWSAYSIISALWEDAAAPTPIQLGAVSAESDIHVVGRDVPVSLVALIMTVFSFAIPNPVLDYDRLNTALRALVGVVRSTPALSTVVVAKLGEQISAGSVATDCLIPIETWLETCVVPTLSHILNRIVELYPQNGGAMALIERRLMDPSSAVVRDAVSAFAYGILVLDAPGSPGRNEKLSLGSYVYGCIDATIKKMADALCNVESSRMTMKLSESGDPVVKTLVSLSSAMRTLSILRSETIVDIVRSKVPTMRNAAQILQAMATLDVYWTPIDIRETSVAVRDWAVPELLKLVVLKQIGGEAGPVDVEPNVLIKTVVDSKDGTALPVALAAFSNVMAVEVALLAHVQIHIAQALTVYCLKEFDAFVGKGLDGTVNLHGAQ